MSLVQQQFDLAQQAASRRRGKYASGQCCSADVSFAIAAATAKVTAANEAYRSEQARKFELDQWFFRRRAAGAEFAAGARAHVISGVNGGIAAVNSGLSALAQSVSSINSGLGAIGSATSAFSNATNGLAGAVGAQGASFAQLSQGAFSFLGYNLTRDTTVQNIAALNSTSSFFSGQTPNQQLYGGFSPTPFSAGAFGGQGNGLLGTYSSPVSTFFGGGNGYIGNGGTAVF